MKNGAIAVLLVVAILAGAVAGYLVSSQEIAMRTVTTTVTTSCPNPSPNVLGGGGGNATINAFLVSVSFQGQWSAVVTTYSALQTTLAYLHSTCDYAGSNTALIYLNPWNSGGEQTVMVTAYKLDSSGGNLTVTVAYGAASRSNSTTLPFGSAKTFISTAP